MIKYFLKKIFIPFHYIRNKTRFWRRKRHALERKLTDLEKITQSMVKIFSWDIHQKILAEPRYMEAKRLLRSGFKAFSQNEEDGITNKNFITYREVLEIFLKPHRRDALNRLIFRRSWA